VTASALSQAGERDRLTVKFAQIDWPLTALLCVIAGVGVAMLYSVAGGSWTPWAFNHVVRFGVALVMMIAIALFSLRFWMFLAYPAYVAGVLLLVAVYFFGTGEDEWGAQRWLDLGPMNLQPSEIMKIAIVLALARFYHGLSAKDAVLSWKLLIPVAMILIPTGLVFQQPDLGTAIMIAATGGAVMVVAGLSLRVIGGLGVIGALVAPAAYLFALTDYQRERITTFLNPEADLAGAGYQIVQSKIALGSGGLLGQGYGLGTQSRLNFLPEKQTDFIFAALAEEFGFLGCFTVLVLYGLAIFLSLRIATLSHSHFGRLLASGVTATFALYILINAAMVMGLAPVVGVPMPMLSYGGTVILTVMVGFGLVQSVRVHRYEEVSSGRGSLI
jgi:rod shape determining protein RodA